MLDQTRIRNWVTSGKFEKRIFWLIGLSTVTLVLSTTGFAPTFLWWCEKVFLAIFTAELLLKLYGLGKDWKNDGWNWFDAIVVILVWIPILGLPVPEGFAFVRTLRLIRLTKADTQMREVVEALISCLPDLFGVFKLCMLFLFIWAVGATKVLQQEMPEDFGNILVSFETMAAAAVFLNPETMAAAIDFSPGIGRFLFLANVITVTFVGLNLVIGVISKALIKLEKTEEMMTKADHERAMEKLREDLMTRLDRLEESLRKTD